MRGVSFDLAAGEILGLGGLWAPAGARSSGDLRRPTASVKGSIAARPQAVDRSPRKAVNAGFGLLPEDRRHEGLVPTLNVMRNVTLASLEKHRIGRSRSRHRGASGGRRTGSSSVSRSGRPGSTPMSSTSPAETRKVVLARWLEKSADVLIFERADRRRRRGAAGGFSLSRARGGGRGVILISSDTSELVLLCHRVVVLAEGRVTSELDSEEITDEASPRLSCAAA